MITESRVIYGIEDLVKILHDVKIKEEIRFVNKTTSTIPHYSDSKMESEYSVIRQSFDTWNVIPHQMEDDDYTKPFTTADLIKMIWVYIIFDNTVKMYIGDNEYRCTCGSLFNDTEFAILNYINSFLYTIKKDLMILYLDKTLKIDDTEE